MQAPQSSSPAGHRAGDRMLLPAERLDDLFAALRAGGYEVLGPRERSGAVVHGPVERASDLPSGVSDRQAPGSYRLERRGDDALFGYAVGPQTWRRHLQPQKQRLLRARRRDGRLQILPERSDAARLALVGVRPCDLAAIAIHDRILAVAQYADPHYAARRREQLVVAVSCTRAGGTCFCASLGTGPAVGPGADLALTELVGPGGHRFVAEVRSEAGAILAGALGLAPAAGADVAEADAAVARAAREMGRSLDADGVAALLARNRESPVWQEVAQRCLSCGSCTFACPTCYCSTVLDAVSLDGAEAERWRRWDSCFTLRHSYIHGGTVRASLAARYRQWMTHKLSGWKEQYGMLGCVGCGRCITWCPARIDLTAEVDAIRAAEAARGEGP